MKTIIETTFTIRDKDSKIEKILGIIGEIETQLKKIQKLYPKLKIEVKKVEEVKRETPH